MTVMETKELDNLNREELFEMLKGKYKKGVKRSIYMGLILLIIAIAFLILFGQRGDFKDLSLLLWVVIGCGCVWFVLYQYRLQKTLDSIVTPERLLHEFDKNNRITKIGGIVMWVAIVATCFIIAVFKGDMSSWASAIGIALAGLMVYLMDSGNTGGQTRRARERNEEFREQLQELADKK